MKFKAIILVVILLVLAGGIVSWYFLNQQESPAIEQPPSINETETGATPISEPATVNKEQEVVVFTDKTSYVLGEKISVRIKNNTDKTIWLAAPCGPPLSLLKANLTVKKNVFDWETHGAYPNIVDCTSPMPPKIESKQDISYMLDLESVYAYEHFSIKPWRYKLEIQYTGVDAKIWPLAQSVYLKSSSNEFFIVAK